MKNRTIVVGGGWAGLACAVELCRAGHQVTLLEAAPQVGGRARSIDFADTRVDNGQHLLIGAYRHILSLLQQLGYGESELFDRRPMQLWLRGADSEGLKLVLSRHLPAPLNLAWGLLRMQGLGWGQRLRALAFALRMRLRGFRLAEDRSVATLLQACGQTPALIHDLWEPLCLATLNTPLHEASAQLFLNVLRDSFTRQRGDSDLLLPRSDIGELLPQRATAWLRHQGAEVLTGQRVKRLLCQQDRINGVECAGQEYLAEQVVLATPAEMTQRLLAPLASMTVLNASLQALGHSPITTVYLQFAQAVQLPYPMLGLLDRHSQWLVDRSHCGQPDILAVVISGPGPHMQMSIEALTDRVVEEVYALLPRLGKPIASRVVRDKRATFRASVEANRLRPAQKTPCPGLYLAADYTHGPYPATLEGAVRSGVQCARLLVSSGPAREEDP